ncbi:CPBP family intramembrane glutamic endopeptidase [Dyella humicola]|uniref:CPBP family intramembrane glutamic endopeptidase n=1 Tax=Dyella humicola TaxID=2992126 RepID=UPI002256ECBB|nr:CPBP family intramembrane glutamic endopeptidase [Dyella humicola]
MSTQAYLGLAQDICAFALVFVLPFVDVPFTRRLKQHSSADGRLIHYRRIVAGTLLVTAVVIVCSGHAGLWDVPRNPGEPAWFERQPWIYALAAALTAAYFALGLWPGLHAMLNHRARPKYSRAMRSLRFLAPVSPRERYWWALVSLTAGICEEILFRGFLLQYLRGHLDGGPHMNIVFAWLVSSIAFGLGHLYQGWAGVCRTTVAGLALGMLAILSGTLALPIVLHVLADLQVLAIYRPTLDAPEEAAALIAGCKCES